MEAGGKSSNSPTHPNPQRNPPGNKKLNFTITDCVERWERNNHWRINGPVYVQIDEQVYARANWPVHKQVSNQVAYRFTPIQNKIEQEMRK